jgi:hypothetical protein
MALGLGSYAQKPALQPSVNATETSSFSINKVYPNPVKDFVTVELQSEVTGTIQVSLFNILGTEVKKWETQSLFNGEQKLRLDLSQLKSGIYILKINKKGLVRTQVLKKN